MMNSYFSFWVCSVENKVNAVFPYFFHLAYYGPFITAPQYSSIMTSHLKHALFPNTTIILLYLIYSLLKSTFIDQQQAVKSIHVGIQKLFLEKLQNALTTSIRSDGEINTFDVVLHFQFLSSAWWDSPIIILNIQMV